MSTENGCQRLTVKPSVINHATIYSVKLPAEITDALATGGDADELHVIFEDAGKCALKFGDINFEGTVADDKMIEVYEKNPRTCTKIGGIHGRITLRKQAFKHPKPPSKPVIEDPNPGTRRPEPSTINRKRATKAKLPPGKRQAQRPSSARTISGRSERTDSTPPRSRPPSSTEPSPNRSKQGLPRSPERGPTARPWSPGGSPSRRSDDRADRGNPTRHRSTSSSPSRRKTVHSGLVSPLNRHDAGKQEPTSAGHSKLKKNNLPPLPPSSRHTPGNHDTEKTSMGTEELRQRSKEVRQLLALRPLTEEQIRDKVAGATREVILRVAELNDLTLKYGLRPEVWPEVDLDAPGSEFTESQKQEIEEKIQRSQMLDDSELNHRLDGKIPSSAHSYGSIKTQGESEKYREAFNGKYRIYNTLGKKIQELMEEINGEYKQWIDSTEDGKRTIEKRVTELKEKTHERDKKMRQYYEVLHTELKSLKKHIKDWSSRPH